jgi:hypothetical protein
MMDKLLWGAMNLVIVTLISTMAATALFCAHTGVLNIFSGNIHGGIILLTLSAGLAGGSGLMIKYRNDLVDR